MHASSISQAHKKIRKTMKPEKLAEIRNPKSRNEIVMNTAGKTERSQ